MQQFITLPVQASGPTDDSFVIIAVSQIVRLAPETGGTRVSLSNGWHVHTATPMEELARLAGIDIIGWPIG